MMFDFGCTISQDWHRDGVGDECIVRRLHNNFTSYYGLCQDETKQVTLQGWQRLNKRL